MTSAVAEALRAHGMSEPASLAKAALFARAAAALGRSGGTAARPPLAIYVPGRIEILGKHTDYGGGRSVLCTVERGFCLVAQPRQDVVVRMLDATSREAVECVMSPALEIVPAHWSNYPMTVARRVARNFPDARVGADVAFASDLPPAAGMSSSSALVTGFFLVLSAVNRLESQPLYAQAIRSREDLAGYLGTIENGQSFGPLAGDRGVGTFGGSEDHTAMLCCRAGCLSVYTFCPVRHEQTLRLPDHLALVIGVSGVVAEKTGAARDDYNRAARALQTVLAIWQRETGRSDPSVAAAVTSSPDAPDRIRRLIASAADAAFSADTLLRRFDQFMAESFEIIPAACRAIASWDPETLGLIVDRSQREAETGLANQVPETIALARLARELGAVAASAFGAGFGGSVWALVAAEDAAAFEARWAERYRGLFPDRATAAAFFTTRPGPPACKL